VQPETGKAAPDVEVDRPRRELRRFFAVLVKEIMTGKVITVTTDDSVERCANLLLEHNISGLPVLDDSGKVVGMVTEGDLIRRASRIKAPGYLEVLGGLIYLGSPKKYVDEIMQAMALQAGNLMTKRVVSVGPEETLESAATLMNRNEVSRLPVIDESGALVGIISRRDIMRNLYGGRI
jgi:CBS domain-containing protein